MLTDAVPDIVLQALPYLQALALSCVLLDAPCRLRQQHGPVHLSLVLLGGQPLIQLEAWVQEMLGFIPWSVVWRPAAFSGTGQPFKVGSVFQCSAVTTVMTVGLILELL